MSFYTSLFFYRPTKPPLITGKSLADFLHAFNALGVAEVHRQLTTQVKFGRRIDKDSKPTTYEEPRHAGMWTVRSIDWDINARYDSLATAVEVLDAESGTIYRACLDLGIATGDIRHALSRVRSPENEVDLTFGDWSMILGPIDSHDLRSDKAFQVGWLAISLSGPGYLWPWTFRNVVDRAEKLSKLTRVSKLCREFWPIESTPPSWSAKRQRRAMNQLWPYEDTSEPWDWYWGLGESG